MLLVEALLLFDDDAISLDGGYAMALSNDKEGSKRYILCVLPIFSFGPRRIKFVPSRFMDGGGLPELLVRFMGCNDKSLSETGDGFLLSFDTCLDVSLLSLVTKGEEEVLESTCKDDRFIVEGSLWFISSLYVSKFTEDCAFRLLEGNGEKERVLDK